MFLGGGGVISWNDGSSDDGRGFVSFSVYDW